MEAVICPTKSHFDTPATAPLRHCVRTCRISVSNRINELAQPNKSTYFTG